MRSLGFVLVPHTQLVKFGTPYSAGRERPFMFLSTTPELVPMRAPLVNSQVP